MKIKLLFYFWFLTVYCSVKGSTFQSRSFPLLTQDTIKFYDGQNFTIIGKFHSEKNYARLPQKYKNTVRNEVWELSQNSAGIAIRFRTNATHISVKWSLIFETFLPHMATTGIKGVDLYGYDNGKWQFVQTGRPQGKTTEYTMLQDGEPIFREYLLNLPLYDGVDTLLIGVNSSAEISIPKEPLLTAKTPVVYYGSSIAQGGCASRPGMAFTNILSRKLDRPFVNMGFSGEGLFETSVGEALCEIGAALYVIDCNPNSEKNIIFERAVKLVNQLKQCKPNTPILLVENFLYANGSLMPEKPLTSDTKRREMRNDKRKELRRAFDTLVKSGVTNIYYQQSDGLIGNDNEATVDGVHPNDLGMMRIADFLLPKISKILKKSMM